MIYNVDYVAGAEGVKIVSLKGYPTEAAAQAAKQGDNVARCIAHGPNDLESLGEPILAALAAYKAKKGQTIEPSAAAIWAVLNPSKPEKNSGQPASTSTTDGATSSSTGDGAGKSKEKKMAKPKKAAKKKAAKKATGTKTGPRGEKTLKVKALLERKSGCTREDILAATGWPAVSVPAMAKAAGLKLRKEKEKGKPTRYFGS